MRKSSTIRHLEEQNTNTGQVVSITDRYKFLSFCFLIVWLFVSCLNQSSGHLEQCGLGGVEFWVAVDHRLHDRRVISYNQQSGAPAKQQIGTCYIDTEGKDTWFDWAEHIKEPGLFFICEVGTCWVHLSPGFFATNCSHFNFLYCNKLRTWQKTMLLTINSNVYKILSNSLECPDVDVSPSNRPLHIQGVAAVVGAEELMHVGLVHCCRDVVTVRSDEVVVGLDLLLKNQFKSKTQKVCVPHVIWRSRPKLPK